MRRTHNISGTTDSEWLALCDSCLFSDCIRAEGEFQPMCKKGRGKKIPGCLIYEAASRDIVPGEALDRLVVTVDGVKAI